jgi:nitroimidazol reductase NimA-like FMN-containing flavoprotein (pyridoxamine 5'-phosphate oxidase superfamily)
MRVRDTLRRLTHDVDCWVATAGFEGGASPYLVPLSFLWDDGALVLATVDDSPTGRNLVRSRVARIGVGVTRDVVLL